jgi:hypothetical protein
MTILIALNLSSCIAVPFPTKVQPLPFPDDQTSQLVPGVTTRPEVIDLLGEPDFEGAGSSLAIYGDDRRVAGLFVAAPQQALGTLAVKTSHVLVVSYDEKKTVQEVDLFRKGLFGNDSEICTTSGICIKPRVNDESGELRILDANFYDTPENDAGAKSFNVPRDRCAVYIYLDTNFWAGEKIHVRSVGHPAPKRHMDKTGFILWLRDSGSLKVVASDQLHSGKPVLPGQQAMSDIEFECLAENAYVIKTTLRWNWGKGIHDLTLSLDEPTEGLAAIRKRRLIIED